ncbi:protein-L-isoaspartate(D-aspartate) O-methyltransferase [Wenzhouxiangella sp. 15181]|nr:protein-L-isoaspartate(D-aspartate) O-methyltransferase [Wenzhouxiangella sp. 15181]RFP68679.1 protein-L-isoaspartate(D-aspartate) O-methyltransferase [Wenzhouxiangella sp. 15190]
MRHLLDSVPRSGFLTSGDLEGIVSGRSIPTREAVERILELIEPLGVRRRVLLVGIGAGYLAAGLARLADDVVVIERSSEVADIATANLARAGIENVRLILGEGELGAPDLAPFDLVLCSARIVKWEGLAEQLAEGGHLVTLEGNDPLVPLVVARARMDGGFKRRELGPVNLAHDAGEIMIDLGYVDEKQLADARVEARRRREPVISVLQRRNDIVDMDLYRSLADRYGLQLTSADDLLKDLDLALFRRFSKTFLDNQRLVPIRSRGGILYVATDNPDVPTEDVARVQAFKSVVKLLVTPTDFRRLWQVIDLSSRGSEMLRWTEQKKEPAHSEDLLDSSDRELSHYLVSLYESILLDAVSAKASDIHVERYGDRIRIRIRVDGELHDLTHYQLTSRDHAGLINVIKVRAEINIAERRLPQGGRSHMRVGTTNYDLRIQIQPSLHGEHAVIRLLSQTGRVLGLRELGMSERVAGFYQRLLDNPAGLVLVVGPTGSGKSTTLYAALQELADDGRRKVITAEDPIEYSIDNIQQTRARPDIGFSFADAMRSFVRQDPDAIMVGEIRDGATALEAMRASQTGHLVLSTLHSNDAVDALQRLYDLQVLPNSIAGELLAIIAQRLAKRICEHCREPAEPDERILRELFPERVPVNFRCFRGRGCKHCNGLGTRGRIAVVEYLQVSDDIRRVISLQPPAGELRWQALDAGLITMRDSALDHVINGTVPLEELPRILPQDRMAPEQRGGRRKQP